MPVLIGNGNNSLLRFNILSAVHLRSEGQVRAVSGYEVHFRKGSSNSENS